MDRLTKHKVKLVFGIIIVVQLNTLINGFVFDDNPAILENVYVQKGWAGIPEILTHPYWHGVRAYKVDIDENYIHYRPVIQIWHATQVQLFGNNPMPFHIISLGLFLGLLALVLTFIQQMGLPENASLLAVLLFGVSPIHVEVVANLKSQDELLMWVLGLTCLVMCVKWLEEQKNSQLIICLCGFLLALFTKEASVTIIGLVAAICWFKGVNMKRSFLLLIPMTIMAALMLIVRDQILPHSPNLANVYLANMGFWERLPNGINILTHYVIKVLYPWPLMHSYDGHQIEPVSWSTWHVWLQLVCWGAALVLICRSAIRRDKWAMWAVFFLVTISVATHILIPISIPFAERLAFMPSLGIYCILAYLLEDRFVVHGKWVKGAVLVLVGLMSVGTIVRNADWRSNQSLFEADFPKARNNFAPIADLGYNYFERALETKDIDRRNELFSKSRELLLLAIKEGGSKFDFYLRLGIVEYELQMHAESKTSINAALQLAEMPSGYFYLARTLIANSELAQADVALERLLQNTGQFDDNELADISYRLGRAYVAKGDYGHGVQWYGQALRHKSCWKDIHMSMGLIYNEQGRVTDAIKSFESDVACRPDSKSAEFLRMLRM